MQAGDPLGFPHDENVTHNAPPAWDFFISYSSHDEADARDIAAIIESTGATTFAQYKDIAPGNNWGREMQRGLDGAERIVALYSPHYEASDHCRTEWLVGYNGDPSGKGQKLVPLLLQPTELNAQARLVQFKSLVGLTGEARRAAVFDAITHRPQRRTREALQAELAKLASPQARINDTGQLDAGPNAVFDKPFVDIDLAQLPAMLRGLIAAILKSLPRNSPASVRNALKAYRDHLLERGTQPIVGYLDIFHEAVMKGAAAADASTWADEALTRMLGGFSECHTKLRTHYPLDNEELLAETPVNDEAVNGAALVDPLAKLGSAVDAAVKANIATPDLGRAVRTSVEVAHDLAFMPADIGVYDPESRTITIKRRYVLGTIGFLSTVLLLISANAEFLAVAEGAALLNAVRKAIEALMAFVF